MQYPKLPKEDLNMNALECANWYGDRIKALLLFTDRDTLERIDVQKHIAKLAELANFYVSISDANQKGLE